MASTTTHPRRVQYGRHGTGLWQTTGATAATATSPTATSPMSPTRSRSTVVPVGSLAQGASGRLPISTRSEAPQRMPWRVWAASHSPHANHHHHHNNSRRSHQPPSSSSTTGTTMATQRAASVSSVVPRRGRAAAEQHLVVRASHSMPGSRSGSYVTALGGTVTAPVSSRRGWPWGLRGTSVAGATTAHGGSGSGAGSRARVAVCSTAVGSRSPNHLAAQARAHTSSSSNNKVPPLPVGTQHVARRYSQLPRRQAKGAPTNAMTTGQQGEIAPTARFLELLHTVFPLLLDFVDFPSALALRRTCTAVRDATNTRREVLHLGTMVCTITLAQHMDILRQALVQRRRSSAADRASYAYQYSFYAAAAARQGAAHSRLGRGSRRGSTRALSIAVRGAAGRRVRRGLRGRCTRCCGPDVDADDSAPGCFAPSASAPGLLLSCAVFLGSLFILFVVIRAITG